MFYVFSPWLNFKTMTRGLTSTLCVPAFILVGMSGGIEEGEAADPKMVKWQNWHPQMYRGFP